MRKNKGFTMMELLIVVAVIAVLIAIATPTFRNAQRRSNENADIQAVSALYTEMQADYEIKGIAASRTVSDMKEDFNGDMSEFGGLDEINWSKGGSVTITVDEDGNFSAEGH